MTTSDLDDDRSHSVSPDDSGDDQEGGDMGEQSDSKDDRRPQNGSKSSNAKDPSRPRRKKARRACYACQRAHLTCGDERPCQRCIKRGLQDACQDGVRKKAKYLHDAPTEALMPGVGTNLFNQGNSVRSHLSVQSPETQQHQNPFFQSTQSYAAYTPGGSMAPPVLHDRSISSASFGQQSPVKHGYSMNPQSSISLSTPALPQTSDLGSSITNAWNGALFDPTDPALFNFDLASMNFGSHYGALEFGMLGHMATGVGGTSPSDSATQRGSTHGVSNQYPIPLGSYSDSPTAQTQFPYNDVVMSDWANGQNSYGQQYSRQNDGPHAFAIESNAANFTSPETEDTPPDALKFEESPILPGFKSSGVTSIPGVHHNPNIVRTSENIRRQSSNISTPQLKARSQLPLKSSKRPRDPSSIYTSVVSPYPYTSGFHSLIAYLQRRFATSPSKTLAIAKSLASIRPSFIATTKTLNRDDLIFMEKCFQRTLWEYEGFIEGVGTPTIVARRTGEIAAAGREFEFLTGWTKRVLLGREPNLNVNRGGSTGSNSAVAGSGANTAGRGTGMNTPNQRPGLGIENESGEKRLQPVFLAELLDDDSVVTFYEDFARLAFGDSRGSVMGRGKLLRYRTKDDEISQNLNAEAESRRDSAENKTNSAPRKLNSMAPRSGTFRREGISNEGEMQTLGAADGKVECTYCWTVKRDVFDIPMLIVMNFLPCL